LRLVRAFGRAGRRARRDRSRRRHSRSIKHRSCSDRSRSATASHDSPISDELSHITADIALSGDTFTSESSRGNSEGSARYGLRHRHDKLRALRQPIVLAHRQRFQLPRHRQRARGSRHLDRTAGDVDRVHQNAMMRGSVRVERGTIYIPTSSRSRSSISTTRVPEQRRHAALAESRGAATRAEAVGGISGSRM